LVVAGPHEVEVEPVDPPGVAEDDVGDLLAGDEVFDGHACIFA
jgi:hypothetical protein